MASARTDLRRAPVVGRRLHHLRPPGPRYLWMILVVAGAIAIVGGVRQGGRVTHEGPETGQHTAGPTPTVSRSDTPGGRPATSPSPPDGTGAPDPRNAVRGGALSGTTLRPGPVRLPALLFVSWALLDRRTGHVTGSPNLAAPSDTMSMIKVWLAADFLRLAAERGRTPGADRLLELRRMIRDSDNSAGEHIYGLVGGRASIERMISRCALTESRPYTRPYWSNTVVSARDTTRLGACLADGRAAGRRWTPWLLDEMRGVRGVGDFGVRRALPPAARAPVAIKNGWLLRDEDGLWHISCLAIGSDWVLGVLARYPGQRGFEYGTRVCRDIGAQLIAHT